MSERKARLDDAGAVAILTAVLAVVLFGLAAFVVDLGLARDNRRQAQNTADAAALAAANALYASDAPRLNQPGNIEAAVDAAEAYAAENYGTTAAEWASCTADDPLPIAADTTNCISFDQVPYPRNVLVVVPLRTQPTLFGGILGYQGISIGALAQARLDPGGRPVCTFCVLGDEQHYLQNGNLTVSGGNLYFNGNVDIGPNGYAGSLEGTVIGEDGTPIVDGGNAYVSGGISGTSTNLQGGKGQAGQPRIVDPLAADVLPFAMQDSLLPKPDGNPCTDGPGIYDGYKSTQPDPCAMQPGLYVFTGDFELSGNAGQLQARGVTFYFTCGEGTVPEECAEGGEGGGGINISGNGGYIIEAPLKTTQPTLEELWGYALVYDRNNVADMRLVGNGDSTVSGTIYGKSATLDLRGNGGTDVPFSSWIVVSDIRFSGTNATLNVAFDATKNRRPSEMDRGLVR
jgi:Flp pilus assembly protein TadG